LIFGRTVDVDVRDMDRYGRLVARVTVDGRDVSLALVQAGLAWYFTRSSRDVRLTEAETHARTHRILRRRRCEVGARDRHRRSNTVGDRTARQPHRHNAWAKKASEAFSTCG
jgi:endonuclease YncB( thermonuclease family)